MYFVESVGIIYISLIKIVENVLCVIILAVGILMFCDLVKFSKSFVLRYICKSIRQLYS